MGQIASFKKWEKFLFEFENAILSLISYLTKFATTNASTLKWMLNSCKYPYLRKQIYTSIRYLTVKLNKLYERFCNGSKFTFDFFYKVMIKSDYNKLVLIIYINKYSRAVQTLALS